MSSMPSYKLTYFDGKGRAEISRYLFAKAGVQYEDVRISRENWPQLKESFPFGQLPALEVDGIVIGQSYAIACFLARRFGLFGSNDIEEAEIHMVCQSMEDFVKPLLSIMSEKDDEKKDSLKKKFTEEQLPKNLKYVNQLLERNNGGNGFFVGDSMTLADMYVTLFLDFPNMVGAKYSLDEYPKLKAVKDKVETDPKIAEWIAKRPQTQF